MLIEIDPDPLRSPSLRAISTLLSCGYTLEPCGRSTISPLNMDCTIENFTWGENDGSKDINFTLEFKEYRKVKVKTTKKKEKVTKKVTPAATQRAAKEVKSTTYTVVKGDNLSKQKLYFCFGKKEEKEIFFNFLFPNKFISPNELTTTCVLLLSLVNSYSDGKTANLKFVLPCFNQISNFAASFMLCRC